MFVVLDALDDIHHRPHGAAALARRGSRAVGRLA